MDEHRDPESYWRRRFLILAGVLAVVAGITGGLSALAGPAKPIGAGAAGRDQASLAAGATLPAAAYGAPAGSRPSPTPTPSTSPTPSASPSATPSRSPSPSRTPSRTASPTSHPAAGKGACSPASIVLSLFTSQGQYTASQDPRFQVYAVSTASGTCQLAFGSSVVRIVVTRQGRVIWDSAACKAGAAAQTTRFTQGVPQVVSISWNRQASGAACRGSAPAGTTGTFDAVAMAAGRSSAVHSFTLSR